MPRYDWKCLDCSATTEVYRSMVESARPPKSPCLRCGSDNFRKSPSKIQVLIPGGRSENSTWPVRIPKAERFMLRNSDGSVQVDAKGIPLVGYKDVVFKNKSEQDDWMSRNGKERMMDGEADSTVSENSAHSVYDQTDNAPSAHAAAVAQNCFFVEDPNEVTDDLKAVTSERVAVETQQLAV